ncbi:hypothetical protein CCP3SC15_570008 [Gammaproteobacteria bacterium]
MLAIRQLIDLAWFVLQVRCELAGERQSAISTCPLTNAQVSKGRTLINHGGIWLIELDKITAHPIESAQDRWLQFFKYAEQFDDTKLPDWMNTPEMSQAMTTLRRFSEKERDYHLYQARQNYLRQQRTIQWEMEEERKGKLQALLREQMALKEKEMAMQEKEMAMQRENQAMKEKEAAMQEKEAAMQEKEAALAEIERLKALLDKGQ